MSYRKMIRMQLLLSCVSLLTFVSCLGTPEERSPFPDIRFEKKTYDFGDLQQGDKAEYTYEFRNGGNDTLRITQVRKGCGCQSAEATRNVIPPGEKGGIKVIFNSRGYSGTITKTVYVHSNDPEEERVALVMKGSVIVDLIVKPRALHFGDVPVGESRTRKVYIVPQHLETLQIGSIQTSADFIQVSTADYVEMGKKGVELDVTLLANAPGPTISENIRVSTNSKMEPVVQIAVNARRYEPITLDPHTIEFQLRPGQSKKYAISVFKAQRKGFRITKVEDDLADIEASIVFVSEEEGTQKYEIELRVDAKATPGARTGVLTVHTNEPGQRRLEMRLAGVVG